MFNFVDSFLSGYAEVYLGLDVDAELAQQNLDCGNAKFFVVDDENSVVALKEELVV